MPANDAFVPTPEQIPPTLEVATCDNGHTLRLAQVPHRFALHPVYIYIEPGPLLLLAAQLILAMHGASPAAQAAPDLRG